MPLSLSLYLPCNCHWCCCCWRHTDRSSTSLPPTEQNRCRVRNRLIQEQSMIYDLSSATTTTTELPDVYKPPSVCCYVYTSLQPGQRQCDAAYWQLNSVQFRHHKQPSEPSCWLRYLCPTSFTSTKSWMCRKLLFLHISRYSQVFS